MATARKKTTRATSTSRGKRSRYTKTSRRSVNSPQVPRYFKFGLIGFFALVAGFLLYRANAATPSTAFYHPGVLVTDKQLAFVKSKVDAGEQPWKGAFDQMKSDFKASKNYTPKPVPKLQCTTSGLLNSYQQIGCTDINNDSAAVYTQALMWKLTGDQAYANKAIQIMNAWSSTLKEVPLDDPNGSDPKNDAEFWQNRLTLGWSSESMIRGAEIMRYSNAGWQQADIDRFEAMLRNIYYPHLAEGWTGTGNGAASWASGLINMGVFLRDDAIYEKGVQHWKQNARSMVYLTSDGSTPQQYLAPRDNKYKVPNYWTVTSYINGLESETCRDLGHTFMGLGAMTNGAETALLHGKYDLYSDPEFKERFTASYELNARYANEVLDYMAANNITDTSLFDDNPSNSPRNPTLANWKPANFPCRDFKVGGGSTFLGSEIALNHFQNRLNISMPNTKKLAERKRPQKGGNHLFFEALTHANTGSVGLPTKPVAPTPTPEPATPASIQLVGLTNGATVQSSLNVEAKLSNATNIQRVRFLIDNTEVASEGIAPYCMGGDSGGVCNNFSITNIADGDHTLKVSALYGDSQTVETSLQFKKTSPPPPAPDPTPTPTPTPTTDTQAPSTPVGLTRSLSANWGRFRYDLKLTWQASSDNVGVQEYVITRNGQPLGTSPNPAYTDSTLKAGTVYTYNVFAKDAAGNTSGPAITTAKANCFWFICSLE